MRRYLKDIARVIRQSKAHRHNPDPVIGSRILALLISGDYLASHTLRGALRINIAVVSGLSVRSRRVHLVYAAIRIFLLSATGTLPVVG